MEKTVLRILLVEDSPSDAELLQETLRQSGAGPFAFSCAERLEDGLARLREASFDVLLLDLSLPDSTGPDTYRRARRAAPRLPIVVLTGLNSEDVGLQAVREGIQDYLTKGQSDGRQIARSIRYAVERAEADEGLRRLNADLQRRTAELEAANEALHASRLAALNLTEDAVRARQQADATNGRLRALMEAVPVGVSFSDDASCQRITGNPAVLAQFEAGPNDNLSASATDHRAPGRQVRFFHDGRQINDAELPLQRAVAENKVIPPMELEIRLPNGRRWFADASGAPVRDAEGNVMGGLAVTVDITERKRAQEALRQARDELELRVQERTADLKHTVHALQLEIQQRKEAEDALRQSEERYRTLFESAPIGIAISNRRGGVLAFNRRLEAMAAVTHEQVQTQQAVRFYANPAVRRRLITQVRQTGQVAKCETTLKRSDGSTILGRLHMNEIQMGRQKVLMTLVEDVTLQKQAERHVEGVRALLELFATKSSLQHYLSSVSKLLQGWCDCRGVGIRLLGEGGLFPYAAHVGFSGGFLRQERSLSLRTGDCACVRILMGKARAEDLPCTSRNGSFFCNSTSRFAEHMMATTANRSQVACLVARYESVAHTPIRYRGQLIGTLHLADPRAGRFPPETITFLESVAPLVGEAIHRFQVEESLRESEERFRTMFERHNTVMLLREPESGALVDANPAAAAFYGHSREHLREMNIADLNALPRAIQDAYRRRLSRRAHEPFVFPHRLANGEIRVVEVHSSPIEIKRRPLLFSIIHDITERRLLEKQVLEISEQERQRVGQDLHDTLGGRLTGAALISKALAQRLTARSLPEAKLAEEVVQSINESIADTRSIARGLCPVELSVAGLNGGLTELASETRRHSGISCRFRGDKQVQIRDLYVATHLFQIAREATTNAIRHGHARHVTIRLARSAGQVSLEVRDDGTGLPKDVDQARGLGLRTMIYRARAVGAQLAIRSSAGGTVVSCLLTGGGAAFNQTDPTK